MLHMHRCQRDPLDIEVERMNSRMETVRALRGSPSPNAATQLALLSYHSRGEYATRPQLSRPSQARDPLDIEADRLKAKMKTLRALGRAPKAAPPKASASVQPASSSRQREFKAIERAVDVLRNHGHRSRSHHR